MAIFYAHILTILNTGTLTLFDSGSGRMKFLRIRLSLIKGAVKSPTPTTAGFFAWLRLRNTA